MASQSTRIAKNLKAARALLGLTQEQVAGRAGVSVGTVAKYEQGKTENPRGEELDAVARAVGKTADALRGVPEEPDDGAADPDDFHSQLARRYGPENAAFVNEVVRCISDFPPKEAAFVRNLLIGAIHGARNPWSNSPSGSPKTAMLVESPGRS